MFGYMLISVQYVEGIACQSPWHQFAAVILPTIHGCAIVPRVGCRAGLASIRTVPQRFACSSTSAVRPRLHYKCCGVGKRLELFGSIDSPVRLLHCR